MGQSLTSKTIHGLKWTYLATAVSVVLQIGFVAVLGRLLTPAAFGLVAMAGVFLRFGSYFAQMGIGQALIQKPQLEPMDIRAAFTASVLVGALFCGLVWVLAPLAVHLLETPEIVPVVRIMGLVFIINGLSVTSLGLLRRRMNFRALSLIEVTSYGLGYGLTGVPLAIFGAGVWSLVAAGLSQAFIMLMMAYLIERHRVRPSFQWSSHRALVRRTVAVHFAVCGGRFRCLPSPPSRVHGSD